MPETTRLEEPEAPLPRLLEACHASDTSLEPQSQDGRRSSARSSGAASRRRKMLSSRSQTDAAELSRSRTTAGGIAGARASTPSTRPALYRRRPTHACRKRWPPGQRPCAPSREASTRRPRQSASSGAPSSRWRLSAKPGRPGRRAAAASRTCAAIVAGGPGERHRGSARLLLRSEAEAETPDTSSHSRRACARQPSPSRNGRPAATQAAPKEKPAAMGGGGRGSWTLPVGPPRPTLKPVTLVPDETPAPYAYKVTIEDRKSPIELVQLHRAFSSIPAVRNLSLLNYLNGVASLPWRPPRRSSRRNLRTPSRRR